MTYLKLFLTATFWGGTFIAGRVLAQTAQPFSAAFLRFIIASLSLVLITYRIEGKLPSLALTQWLAVGLLGVTGVFAYNVCFFKGLQTIHASRASLIVATNPIFISLLASLFLKEKMRWLNGIGIVLSVFGAMVVISKGNLQEIVRGNIGPGELFIFGCVLSWVTYSLIGKVVMKDVSPLIAVSYSAVIGTVLLFWPAYSEGLLSNLGEYSSMDWLSLCYLGWFGTVLGFLWYYQGIRAIGPARASQFINFVPVSAIVLAFFLLDEPVTRSLIIGAALVLGGVYLTNTSRAEKRDESKKPIH